MKHKPSKMHSNRKLYNWLIYDIGDKFLNKYSNYYKGCLVDLGCGEAPYREYFLQFADKYVGVDWASSYHNIAADVISDLNEKIDLPDEYADTIISLAVMEHLKEPKTFLSEAYRILKKGGVIILQVPFQWWVHEAPYDYFRFTPYGLKYLLENAGFKDIHIEPMNGFFTMWLLKFNYFTLRFISGPKIVKGFIKALLIPLWTVNQIIAPYLDKLLDKNWELETAGYFVIARKI